MQKLTKRFKEWFIKKLGGHTPMLEVKCYKPNPIELYAVTKVSEYIDEDKIKEQLIHMIAEEIKNKKLYELAQGREFYHTGELICRMKVLVVEPLEGR